jgi:elongation factor G
MATVDTAQLRNLVLLSHGGAGKTSLVEAMAFSAGAISRLGAVEDGTTVSDFDADEQHRGMSISTSIVSFDSHGARINLIDTPGYADFIGETIAGASVADAALILVDAAAGVEVGTETAWRLAERRSMPRVIVVNRLDRENADWDTVVSSIQSGLGPQCQPLHLPIGAESAFEGLVDVLGGKAYRADGSTASDIPDDLASSVAATRDALVERIAEADDDLTLKFLEGEELTNDEITNGLKHAIVAGTLVPIVCAAGIANIGTHPLLRLIAEELPSPLDVAPIVAEADGDSIELPPDPAGPPALMIFKTAADEFVGRLSYFRVYSGTIPADAHLHNMESDSEERLAHISHICGKELTAVEALVPGDIGAVTKLSESRTFDTLCDNKRRVVLPKPALPSPVFSAAIAPKTKADVDKLGAGLHRLLEEDLTLRMERDGDTGDTILSGLGESHVELAAAKMHSKFHVDVEIHDRRIPYRETITTEARAEYLHKKQSGGHGQYARVAIRVEPLHRGDGFEFASEVVGGNVPRQYIPAVEKGVAETLPGGVIAHYPMTDIRVVLIDGKHHDVDSSEMAFKTAAHQALREAATSARPILLEPIMTYHITVPESATGDIISDLNGRRARVMGMEPSADIPGATVVSAEGSMAEFLHYATDLRSMTGGRGTFTSDFARYDPVPDHVTKKVVEKANADAKADAGHS